MAQSKYSLRDQPSQKFNGEDDEWVLNRKTKRSAEKFTCLKCHDIFKSEKSLKTHEITCLKLGEKDSFLKFQPRVVLRDALGDKVALPPSQETESSESANDNNQSHDSQSPDENEALPPSQEENTASLQSNHTLPQQMKLLQ